MIDQKVLRAQPELVREGLAKRASKVDLDSLLAKDARRRALLAEVEQKRHELKKASDAFAREGGSSDGLKALSQSIKQQEQDVKALDAEVLQALAFIPNIPHESVPVGPAASGVVVREHGAKPGFDFKPADHLELGERLGILDLPRAAKVTGSHFPLLRGRGAQLERALIQWMLDIHTREHGYTEIAPPFLVNADSMFGTGQLPKFEEDMYRLKDDPFYLVPTAEVPVTNLHRDEILEEDALPVKYTAYTPCFRREAGSYGKETRGMVRVHQFSKVELVNFVRPEDSYAALEALVGEAEVILQRLGIHYRVVALASQDLGFSAAKCYDLEAWAPGLGQYLEVSSCSNFEGFQARRANIRLRRGGTKKVEPVHTLNGSGLALARTLICVLETYQQADGRIRVPEALRPYFHGEEIL